LADSVVDPHEVSFFSELGDDLSSAYALSLACDHCDRHEALLRSGVDSALDRLESFRKVADGKVVSKLQASFATLPVAFAPGVPVGDGFARRCISRQLVCGDVLQVLVFGRAWVPGVSPAAMKTWRSGVPRLDSEGATSVGVLESAWASGVQDYNNFNKQVGTRTDYSVGPWDYPACAARFLKAWSTRTTQE
jgi:hypothetical protein